MKRFLGPAFHRDIHQDIEGFEDMQTFLQTTRLPGCESLLIDPGAFDNLTGDAWANRMKTMAQEAGLETKLMEMSKPIGIEGVGQNSQTASLAVVVPGAVLDRKQQKRPITFQAPVVPNSEIPALWVRRSLARNRAMLGMVNNKLYLRGGERIQFVPPPGSLELDLQLSPSGHLMLPITLLTISSSMTPVNLLASIPFAEMSREERVALANQILREEH